MNNLIKSKTLKPFVNSIYYQKQCTNFKEKEEYNMELIPKCTPEIWKGYNVLSPVEAIKNYDTGENN